MPRAGDNFGGDDLKIYTDRPETLLLFRSLILAWWKLAGMDVDKATEGVEFYLGINPHSPDGDRLSGYHYRYKNDKWIVIPKLHWEYGLQEPYMLTVHHEMGHHVHKEFMDSDGSELWQEWSELTGKKLDFTPRRVGRKEVMNTPSYEDFANDFAKTVTGSREIPIQFWIERLKFYFSLWGQVLNLQIELPIGKPQMIINGRVQEIDVPALIIDGRTMVPLRVVSEALGAEVDWEPKDGPVERVIIIKEG